VAAVADTTGGRLAGVATALAGAALVLAAAALLLRWPVLIGWAVLVAGGGYLIGREGRAVVDGRAAVVGVLLLLGAELAVWSIEHDKRVRADRAVVVRQAANLAGLALVALAVNAALLGAASLPGGNGIAVTLLGIGAAVGAIAIVVRLIKAAPGGSSPGGP
jgi:hypothetical protein